MDHQQVEDSNIIVPPVRVHVMVIDDDATSLAIVSSLLRALNYEVSSFYDPIRALYTLRVGKQSFDLILTALYMPKMDGFELTRRVNEEFKIPKYRIFLRKVAERCMISSDKTTEEIIWSKFLSRHASFVLEKIQQKRSFNLNSSQNPNFPPFPNRDQCSNPNNGDRCRFTNGQLSFAKKLPLYNIGHTASFTNNVDPLSMNVDNNAQAFNFSGSQFQNSTPFQDPYLGLSFSSNNIYHGGSSVGLNGEISTTQNNVSNGNYVGFDGNYVGFGFGGDHNSYDWGLMCNNNEINFGGASQGTMSHSNHALDNKQQDSVGFMKDQSHQLNNMYITDDESSTFDPLSIDDQASFLI
ncbi:Two-component response regulator ORR21, partial [Cucurbita argyrosperma subsp. argyrosperma]